MQLQRVVSFCDKCKCKKRHRTSKDTTLNVKGYFFVDKSLSGRFLPFFARDRYCREIVCWSQGRGRGGFLPLLCPVSGVRPCSPVYHHRRSPPLQSQHPTHRVYIGLTLMSLSYRIFLLEHMQLKLSVTSLLIN